MEGLFMMIILIGVIVGFMWISEKYGGITIGPKYGGQSSSKMNQTIDSLYNYELKNNPKLVEYAINKVKQKKFALTKTNVLSEIDTIKKDKALMEIINKL